MRGIFFALSAVNSFVPEAITPIGTQQLKTASASFATPSMKTTAGGDCSDTVSFTNNCTGLNRAYISNGQLVQLSRYYYKLKSEPFLSVKNFGLKETTLWLNRLKNTGVFMLATK